MKTRILVEAEINGRMFTLECSPQSTYEEIKEMGQYLVRMADERLRSMQENPKVEELPQE